MILSQKINSTVQDCISNYEKYINNMIDRNNNNNGN